MPTATTLQLVLKTLSPVASLENDSLKSAIFSRPTAATSKAAAKRAAVDLTGASSPLSHRPLSSIADLKAMASAGVDDLRRQIDHSHSEILKDLEASHSRLHKRLKMQTQACHQVMDEAEKEYKKFSKRITESREAMKASYDEFMAEAQASASRVIILCKLTYNSYLKLIMVMASHCYLVGSSGELFIEYLVRHCALTDNNRGDLDILNKRVEFSEAVYKRSTFPVFKAHGLAQASIADCVSETFSTIQTTIDNSKINYYRYDLLVVKIGRCLHLLNSSLQVLSFQSSGIKLGTFKSFNESMTRVAIYISLILLYCLGGNKVKVVQGLVNTFGDLRGAFTAVDKINSVLSRV
ncbi:hypothetical protein S245_001718 [Arachis hypogaea]